MRAIAETLAETNLTVLPDDTYMGSDGLAHCVWCNEPRQFVFEATYLARPKIVACTCKCMKEKSKKEEQKLLLQATRQQSIHMAPDGLSIPCWRQVSFDEFDMDADPLRKIATFSKNIVRLKDERIGFLFFGCPGCGKTTAALHVAQSAEAQGLTTLVTSPTRIVNGMLGTSTKGKNEFVDTLCRFDVVVIDDFGTERSTEYSQEQLFCVIDALYRSNALLVITTNLSLAEMRNTKDLMKSRINSRILERCRAVSFPNVDFRINAAKKEYLRAKEIFDEL